RDDDTVLTGPGLDVDVLVFERGGVLRLAQAAKFDNQPIVIRCKDLVIHDMEAPGTIMHPDIPPLIGKPPGTKGPDAIDFDRWTSKGRGRHGLPGIRGQDGPAGK